MHQMVDEAIALLGGTGSITELAAFSTPHGGSNAASPIGQHFPHRLHLRARPRSPEPLAASFSARAAAASAFVLPSLIGIPRLSKPGELLSVPVPFRDEGSHILFDENPQRAGRGKIIPALSKEPLSLRRGSLPGSVQGPRAMTVSLSSSSPFPCNSQIKAKTSNHTSFFFSFFLYIFFSSSSFHST